MDAHFPTAPLIHSWPKPNHHHHQGLGHEFLKHIERTKVLLYVLDGLGGPTATADARSQREGGGGCGSGDDGSVTDEPPALVLRKLRDELERYRPGLARRPSLVWINKADVDPATALRAREAVAAALAEVWGEAEGSHEPVPIMVGSAKTGERIGELAVALRQTLAGLQGGGGDGSGGGSRAGQKDDGATRGGSGVSQQGLAAANTAAAAAEKEERASAMLLAGACAAALDAAQAHQSGWDAAVADAAANVHRVRCYGAALEVVRRHNIYLGWAKADALAMAMAGAGGKRPGPRPGGTIREIDA